MSVVRRSIGDRARVGLLRSLGGALVLASLASLATCQSAPPAPSSQKVADTQADFLPPGSSLQGARRLVVTVDPQRFSKAGGYSGTFTLTNRGKETVILASVVTASNHVRATSPGAMPYRVDPGKSFSVTVSVSLPWDRAFVDGGIARVLTTEGETINLWLQFVNPQHVAPVSAMSAGVR